LVREKQKKTEKKLVSTKRFTAITLRRRAAAVAVVAFAFAFAVALAAAV